MSNGNVPPSLKPGVVVSEYAAFPYRNNSDRMSFRTVSSVGTGVTRRFCFPIIFSEVAENDRKNEKIVFSVYTGRLARRTTLESDRKEIGFSVLYLETFKPWPACYKITVACLRRNKIFFYRGWHFFFRKSYVASKSWILVRVIRVCPTRFGLWPKQRFDRDDSSVSNS